MLVPQPEGHPVRSCISLNPKKATLKKAKQFYIVLLNTVSQKMKTKEREKERERELYSLVNFPDG